MWGHDEIEVAEASPELRRIAELFWGCWQFDAVFSTAFNI
jgi:hypothetical protein